MHVCCYMVERHTCFENKKTQMYHTSFLNVLFSKVESKLECSKASGKRSKIIIE